MQAEHFRFAEPLVLGWGLVLVGMALLLYLYGFYQKRRAKAALGDAILIERLSGQVSVWRQRLKAFLVVLALSLYVIALARPQVAKKLLTVKQKGLDIVVALDVSSSMLAEDVKPNRLTVAKWALEGLLSRLRGDHVGLVLFAGSGHLQCPLTSDYGALQMFLELIDTQAVQAPGSYLADAIRQSLQALPPIQKSDKVILLITDGEDQGSDVRQAAREAAERGAKIFALGVGTPRGAPLPVRNERGQLTGYKHDRQGQLVISKANFALLQEVTRSTGGKFYVANSHPLAVQKLSHDLSKLKRKLAESRRFAQYEERFQIPLVLGTILLCLEWVLSERRRKRRE